MLEGQKQHLHRKSCQLSSLRMSSDTRGGKLDHEMQMHRKRECTGYRVPQDKKASSLQIRSLGSFRGVLLGFQESAKAAPSLGRLPKHKGPSPGPPHSS